MGAIVIPDTRGQDMQRMLMQWMEQSDAKKREQEMLRQQEEVLRRNALVRQYEGLAPEQRSAAYGALPEDVRGYTIDPSIIPMTEEQRLAQESAAKLRAIQSGFQPDQFQSDYIATENLLGRNPNAQFTETIRDKSYMAPQDFQTHINEGSIPKSQVEQNRAAAAESNADAAFTSGPKTATENAQGAKYRTETAQVGKPAPVHPGASATTVDVSGFPASVVAAGDDVLRGGDINRIPYQSRMAVFEYVAKKGGKAIPTDVAKTLRGQIAAETAIDQIKTAFEQYAAAKSPGDIAKQAVNLRAKVYGTVPLLARGIGHTGVLTQQDVDSVVASLLGASGAAGLTMAKAMPGETRSRINGMKSQFSELQKRLLEDLIPAGGNGGAGGKTVTRAELQQMGSSAEEAAAAGYTVVD